MSTRLPRWLVQEIPTQEAWNFSNLLKEKFRLNTVCDSTLCPNRPTCYSKKQVTFLILGNSCSRDCRFCYIEKQLTQPVDEEEPYRIAACCAELDISYIVVSSVTRDDLDDGGAGHFAKTIKLIKEYRPSTGIEVLIPDFNGSLKSLDKVVAEGPDVVSHNIETVKRLYSLRSKADYIRSLSVLRAVKFLNWRQRTKSSIMLGLGEIDFEIEQTLWDLRKVYCDMVVLGQYLAPSKYHYPVQKFYKLEEFFFWKTVAKDLGFYSVCSEPLARTSYLAKEQSQLCTM